MILVPQSCPILFIMVPRLGQLRRNAQIRQFIIACIYEAKHIIHNCALCCPILQHRFLKRGIVHFPTISMSCRYLSCIGIGDKLLCHTEVARDVTLKHTHTHPHTHAMSIHHAHEDNNGHVPEWRRGILHGNTLEGGRQDTANCWQHGTYLSPSLTSWAPVGGRGHNRQPLYVGTSIWGFNTNSVGPWSLEGHAFAQLRLRQRHTLLLTATSCGVNTNTATMKKRGGTIPKGVDGA